MIADSFLWGFFRLRGGVRVVWVRASRDARRRRALTFFLYLA